MRLRIILPLLLFIGIVNLAWASTTVGTIDGVYKYAWGENMGWLNFAATSGNIQVTDTALTGYIWNQNYGWINLAPTNSGQGVTNDSEGNLSGQAWAQGLGFIDFENVTINSSGKFTGIAGTEGTTAGRISFDCINCDVRTDWRPASTRGGDATPTPTSVSSGGSRVVFLPIISPIIDVIQPVVTPVVDGLKALVGDLGQGFLALLPKPAIPPSIPVADLIPRIAPLALRGQWDLLNQAEIGRFVFAPLPESISLLASRFPELGKTLEQVGITRLADLDKLQQSQFTLPGLGQLGNNLPENVIFAQGAGGLVDFNIALSFNSQGDVGQSINVVAGQTIHLEIKPDAPVKKVDGFLVLKGNPTMAQREGLPLGSLVAAAFLAKPRQVEHKLVLQQFTYTDPDGDGIYTADIASPQVAGEYEVITVMNYQSVKLGRKEIRLTTVVDPEGYIYETSIGKETRIPDAVASIFWLNPATTKYELWPAKTFQQTNPQVTDVRGTYSFLVPPGNYYLTVKAPGYNDYRGTAFTVEAGSSGIHRNIELQAKSSWFHFFSWQTLFLIIVILLLLYNFYRDKIRDIRLHKK